MSGSCCGDFGVEEMIVRLHRRQYLAKNDVYFWIFSGRNYKESMIFAVSGLEFRTRRKEVADKLRAARAKEKSQKCEK
jgi:hypothetical protein